MALSASGIATGQRGYAAQVLQFFNLLTGVMTDQPVTLKNTMTLGGNQAASNGHLLSLQGVQNQLADYIRVYAYGNGTPIWSIDKDGQQIYSGPLVFTELGSDPSAPAAGSLSLFARGDEKLYFLLSDSTKREIVTASGTQTLADKTLTAPTIADFTNAAHDHGDADDAGALAPAALKLTVTAKTGDYTTAWGEHVDVDASGGAVTITLPAVGASPGGVIEVRKIDSSANAVTVQRAGADTINDATTFVLYSQFDSATLRNLGSGKVGVV